MRQTPTASPGEIVVVLVEDEATVKRYYPAHDHIRLEPANRNMDPIIIPRDRLEQTHILGVVTGVYRTIR